ncbi:unnamed protein product [Rotaria sp. Silwood2]|nr:unnamed protein product [Rotaria sp. Silwood2]
MIIFIFYSSLTRWSCCCLQTTFQGQSFKETIHLYDQLLPLCPIMIYFILFLSLKFAIYIFCLNRFCLSATCPIWRGCLSDIDSQWNMLGESGDDQTLKFL